MDTDCSYTRQTLQTAVSAAVSAFSEHSGGGSGFHFPSSPWGVINLCSISYSNLNIQPSFSFRITSIRRSTHLVAECDLYLVPFLRTISDSAAVVTPPMALVVKIRLTYFFIYSVHTSLHPYD